MRVITRYWHVYGNSIKSHPKLAEAIDVVDHDGDENLDGEREF